MALSLAELGWDALGRRRRGGGARPVRARAPLEGRLRESPEIAGALHSGIARARERLGQLGPAAEQDDLAVDADRVRPPRHALRGCAASASGGCGRASSAARSPCGTGCWSTRGPSRHAERALELAEQARSRTLLDLVSRGVVPVRPGGRRCARGPSSACARTSWRATWASSPSPSTSRAPGRGSSRATPARWPPCRAGGRSSARCGPGDAASRRARRRPRATGRGVSAPRVLLSRRGPGSPPCAAS